MAAAGAPSPDLQQRVYHALQAAPQGVDDETLRERFGVSAQELLAVLQPMLDSHKASVFIANGVPKYRVNTQEEEEAAQKLQQLDEVHRLVYQEIERSARRGIWTRDLKRATSLQQARMTSILKTLENKRLIKSCRSYRHKNRKMYILASLELDEELEGGPFVTDDDFDEEFVSKVCTVVEGVLRKMPRGATLSAVVDAVASSGVSKVELKKKDIEQILDVLRWDGRAEEIPSLMDAGERVFRVASKVPVMDYMTAAPCGVCPVFDECTEGGVISPATCPYLSKWLSY